MQVGKRAAGRVMVILASGGIALGAAAPVSAENFAGCASSGNPCFANNSTHYMSYNLTTGWRAATEATRTQSYETTNLVTILAAHDSSDVYYEVETQQTNYYGIYFCVTPGSYGTCNHAHVTYNGPNGSGLTSSELQSVACHETGHTLGLRHPDFIPAPDDPNVYQCMVVNGFPAFLGAHNVKHINDWYF